MNLIKNNRFELGFRIFLNNIFVNFLLINGELKSGGVNMWKVSLMNCFPFSFLCMYGKMIEYFNYSIIL